MDKKYHNTYDTLNNNLDREKDNENKLSKNIEIGKKKQYLLPKNNSNNDEIFLQSLSKINNFDVSKKLKRTNKSFNQAYFHLRNVNYDNKVE